MTSDLRNFEQWQASLRNFDWVAGAGVSGACDVDLMLERKGRFLFIEGKPREGPQIYVPLGQWIALRELSTLPHVSVWLVAEDERAKEEDTLNHYSVFRFFGSARYHKDGLRNGQKQAVLYTDTRTVEHVSLTELQALVREWWADK